MRRTNLLTLYNFKVIIFFQMGICPVLSLISCPKQFLYQIGTKTTCMTESGWSIPCDNQDVKKAHIQCINDYYNHLNNQTIECNINTGRWSHLPWRCFPPQAECTTEGNPEKIELISDQTQYPTYYVEILKRLPISGEQNAFPGRIMNAKLIITREIFFDKRVPFKPQNFIVRHYKGESFEDYDIERIEYMDREITYGYDNNKNFERYCILVLARNNYIRLQRGITETVCFHYDVPIYKANKRFFEVMRSRLEFNLLPNYSRECVVPHVEKKRVDLMCYSSLKSKRLLDCPESVPALQARCQIGYTNKNTADGDIVTMCVEGRWSVNYTSSRDCDLICGEVEENLSSQTEYIHNGQKSKIESAPWHVGIYSNKTKELHTFICSGSIIHKNIVISAAHCFYNQDTEMMEDTSYYLVGAGKLFYSYNNSEKSGQFVRVQKLKFPRQYSRFRNDIAIVIVSPDFIYTPNVKPICVDWVSDYDLADGTEGHIFGWGATDKSNILSEQLLTTKLKVVNNIECKKLHDKIEISDENFCGISSSGGTACQGDSGGGFVIEKIVDNKVRYFLWGVISSGIGYDDYCTNNSITALTNIHYFPEIRRIITKTRNKFNRKKLSELVWHQIYGHQLWEPSDWVRNELQLSLSGTYYSELPETNIFL